MKISSLYKRNDSNQKDIETCFCVVFFFLNFPSVFTELLYCLFTFRCTRALGYVGFYLEHLFLSLFFKEIKK